MSIFLGDIYDGAIRKYCKCIRKRLKKHSISGKTVTLKIKYSDFTQQTRSKTVPYFISDKGLILETVKNFCIRNA
jgi:DNA polymerase-4